MEGCQHNTMDVEYFGPNPQMGIWYLGALKAASLMANQTGDNAFAEKCQRLFLNGQKWLEENLFNGEYFEHKIIPPAELKKVRPELILHPTIYNETLPGLCFQMYDRG
jgi:hypothetical protein